MRETPTCGRLADASRGISAGETGQPFQFRSHGPGGRSPVPSAGEPSHLSPLILLGVSFVALPAPLLTGRTSLGRVLLTAYLYERHGFDVPKSEL